MLKQERYNIITDLVRQQQSVKSSELMQLFDVSDETIRRDLAALEKKGLLKCVHGGAVYSSSTTNEYHIDIRIKKNQREKETICEEAARLINDGEAVAIGGSTTTLALSRYLMMKNNLTIITNSVVLANQLAENETHKVILVGGRLIRESKKTLGSDTAANFLKYRVDKTLFSVAGITPKDGMSEYSEEEAEIAGTLIKIARESILLNDYTKFSTVALRHVGDIEDIDYIVTDANTPWNELKPYSQAGIKICKSAKR